MSVWDDIFQTYKDAGFTASETPELEDTQQSRPTMYILAYFDANNGGINDHLSDEERITLLEMKLQAQELRLRALEDRYDSLMEKLKVNTPKHTKRNSKRKLQSNGDDSQVKSGPSSEA